MGISANDVYWKALVRTSLLMAFCFLLFAAIPIDAPIADASMRNDAVQVRLLIANGADVNAAHGDGMTGLHWAAENGNPNSMMSVPPLTRPSTIDNVAFSFGKPVIMYEINAFSFLDFNSLNLS